MSDARDNFYKELRDGEGHIILAINQMRDICHSANVLNGWWHDPHTGDKVERNVGELIALMHSELSEALEGYRKNLKDDHLPDFDSITVEFADTIIRIMDCAGALDLPVGEALIAKMLYNAERSDHKPENRVKEGGKKF